MNGAGAELELETGQETRFFASYSGVKLPPKLVNAIEPDALSNRNTFIRAYFDGVGALKGFDKLVYGEVELAHRYDYYDSGVLRRAQVAMLDEEPVVIHFDQAGRQISGEKEP